MQKTLQKPVSLENQTNLGIGLHNVYILYFLHAFQSLSVLYAT
jgi:hypothetical protein